MAALPLLTSIVIAAVLSDAAVRAGAARDDGTEVLLTKVQALRAVFPDCDHALELRHLLAEDEQRRLAATLQRDLGEKGFLVYLGLNGERLDGFAVITNEIGKTEPITMIVAAEPDGRVRRCAVMVYRESHGGEVRSRRFLAQLEGKTVADPLQVHRDVLHVSGATLSSIALCNGTRKVLALLEQDFLRLPQDELIAKARREGAKSFDLRAAGASAAAVATRFDARRLVMGSELSIVALVDDPTIAAGAHAVLQEALTAAEALDAVLSDWRDDSELAEVNRSAFAGPMAVSAAMAGFLDESETLWRASGGTFDPAIGELVRAWGFRGGSPTRPSAERLAELVAGGGFAGVAFDRAACTVAFTRPFVRLDPGAIGKGLAVDAAIEVLHARGLRNAMVDFGSSQRAIGGGEDGAGWPVAIRDPVDATRALEVVLLRDQSLSTSGGYEQFVEIDGDRFPHLIDPRDGQPVRDCVSVSVLAPTAARADALSTAVFVAGADASAAFLAALPPAMAGTGALLVPVHGVTQRLAAWPGAADSAQDSAACVTR